MKRQWRYLILAILLLLVLAIGISIWRAPDWIRSYLVAELERVGLQVQQLDQPHLSWRGITFDNARLRWQQATTQVDIDIQHLVTGIHWTEQRVETLRIGQLTLKLQSAGDNQPSAWPALQLPLLPIERISIDSLNAELQRPTQTLTLHGALQLTPGAQQWQLHWQAPNYQLTADLSQQQGWQLNARLDAENQHAELSLRSVQNELTNSTWQWQLKTPLSMMTLWPMPPQTLSLAGDLTASGTLQLGMNSGEWLAANADVQIVSFSATQDPFSVQGRIQANLGLTPEQANLTLQPETQLNLAPLPQWQLSATALNFPSALQAQFALDELPTPLLTIRGQLQASVQYQDVATRWSVDASKQPLKIDTSAPFLPLQFEAHAKQWTFADARFQQLAANGSLQLRKLDQQWQIATDQPTKLSWQSIRYQDFIVQAGTAALNAKAHFEAEFALDTLTTELQDARWQIRQMDTDYTLHHGRIHYQQQRQGVSVALNADQASMQTPDQKISIQQLHVEANGKDVAALKKHVQVNAKQLDHPLLQDWPKPNVQLTASDQAELAEHSLSGFYRASRWRTVVGTKAVHRFFRPTRFDQSPGPRQRPLALAGHAVATNAYPQA